jgi:pimeloyl-ACP methyl ester carboxylesterase
VPSSSQLQVLSSGAVNSNAVHRPHPAINSNVTIDSTKITIVLTHGLNSSAAAWPASMASAFGANVNVLAWDWSSDAATASSDPLRAAYAASRAPNQGRALGQALAAALGAGYNQPIHFIGSGLGAIVNCEAENYLLGGAGATFSASNIQMTMLDEAGDLVNSLLTKPDNVLSIASDGSSSSQTLTNRWANAIPAHSAWVDNYISAPGYLESQAANVFLFRNALSANPCPLNAAH